MRLVIAWTACCNLLACDSVESPPPSTAASPTQLEATVPSSTLIRYGSGLTDDVLADIIDGHLGNIEVIGLANNKLTAQSMAHILASEKTVTLTDLDLQGNPDLSDAAVQMLADSPRLSNLTHLYLSGSGITAAGFAHLAASPHHGALQFLSANVQPLGDDGGTAIAQIPGLTVINLEQTEIGGRGTSALLQVPTLTALNLSQNPIATGSLSTLQGMSPSLNILILKDTGIGPADLDALLAHAPDSLQFLNLMACPLGDSGLRALAGWSGLSQLVSLTVPRAGASPAANQALRDAWGSRPGLTTDRR